MEREAKPDHGRKKEREKNETPMMQTRRVLEKVAGIGFSGLACDGRRIQERSKGTWAQK